MNIKESSKDYIGDPVMHKTNDNNEVAIFQKKWTWAEKGGAPACTQLAARTTVSFVEDPNSVRTNHIDFNTNHYAYTASNYPSGGCVLSGNQMSVSIGIWYDADITDSEIDRQTRILGGPWTGNGTLYFPGDITQFVVQPTDPNYTGEIWIVIRQNAVGYCGPAPAITYTFSNYQYEVRR